MALAALLTWAPLAGAEDWEDLQRQAGEHFEKASAGVEGMASTMEALDAKRSGAFVSAHLLAAQILLANTRSGRHAYTEVAARVTAAHAKRPRTGKCARVMMQYGQAMAMIAKGERKAAVAPLEQALDVFCKESWLDLATHAATELCALHVAPNDAPAARAALARVTKRVTPETDPYVIQDWRGMVRTRLGDAPGPVLADYHRAMESFSRTKMRGRGGAGGVGGLPEGDSTEVGRALRRMKGTRVVLTVRRTDAGFSIRKGYDRSFEEVHPFENGVTHFCSGGIVLSFHGYAVALRRVDLITGPGGPGGTMQPDPVRAYYHLGRGETYTLTASGRVTIR